ncbi:MAG: Gldg family protein [Planctomycetota bacterium]|nr:Gldg family protein [Planctomycetota bacterium]
MSARLQTIVLFACVLALFIGVNMLSERLLAGARLDTTQGSIFTLTQGSRNIARSPAEPVTLTLYYAASAATGRPELESYARRVRELLREFAGASRGKVVLREVDPAPFSEAEDDAVRAGLTGVPLDAGRTLYLGLVGTNTIDTREVIAFFDPRRERFLEYDVARLVYSLANPTRKAVGVISSLRIDGGFAIDPRTRQPTQTPAWRVMEEMKGLFDVRMLNAPTSIPDDLDALMVVHPKDLPPSTLYAIDQFVMRGGHLLLFQDPNCENDDTGGQFAFGGDRSSSLEPLLKAWGIDSPDGMVAADAAMALRVFAGDRNNPEPVPYVVWLEARAGQMASDDAVTGVLGRVMLASSGYFNTAEGSTLALTPLISTTGTAMAMPTTDIGFPPDPKALQKKFTPGSAALVLAARVEGAVTSAFPDGPPPPPEGQEAPADLPAHMAASTGPVTMIIAGDVDMLADGMWIRRQDFFGSPMVQRLADNGDFVLGALENLTGGKDLTTVRARRDTNRPFTVVERMQRDADQRALAEQAMLEESLRDTQAELDKLQAARSDAEGSPMLTPEQRAKVEEFRATMLDTRKKLREVNRTLRADIETLGLQLKFINTALMPLLVAFIAILLAILRRARRARAL